MGNVSVRQTKINVRQLKKNVQQTKINVRQLKKNVQQTNFWVDNSKNKCQNRNIFSTPEEKVSTTEENFGRQK